MALPGALTTLQAVGPQEKFMYDGKSQWIPDVVRHSNFALTRRMLPVIPQIGGSYLSTQYQIPIYPQQEGDLLTNVFLSVSLPALPTGYNYCELVGRAIIKKAEILIDGNVIESVEDDWYVIRDQLFLNADEKLSMYQNISAGQAESNVVPATTQVNLMVPLDFFFCRRKRRQGKPYLPLCALTKSSIIIRITFNTQAWITNYTAASIDLLNPRLLLEEITLTPEERMYYANNPMKFKIPVAQKEAVQSYNNGTVRMNLTADFPVSMLVWFVRNKLYESTSSSVYYASRYTYGYSTDYIISAVPMTFFNGVIQHFVDIIKSATIYINNKNVLSNFPGALYYSYKQPFDHKLTVPTKNMYMYCFGDDPSTYSQDGTVDFKKLDSQTTYIDMTFDSTLVPQIAQGYNMYLYYYGYRTLVISGGKLTMT
jgi:hypothetical protein